MGGWRQKVELACLFIIAIAPAEFNWYYNPRLAGNPRMFWTMDVGRFVVLPAFLGVWGIARGLFTPADLGLHGRVFGRRNPFLMLATIIAVSVFLCRLDTSVIRWAAELYPPNPYAEPPFSYNQMIPPSGPETGWYRLLAVCYLALGAAFVEELLFRGVLRHLFGRGVMGTIVFLLLSPLLFASVHCFGGPMKVVYALALGAAFGVVYVATGNLWPLIVAHLSIDFYWFSVG